MELISHKEIEFIDFVCSSKSSRFMLQWFGKKLEQLSNRFDQTKLSFIYDHTMNLIDEDNLNLNLFYLLNTMK